MALTIPTSRTAQSQLVLPPHKLSATQTHTKIIRQQHNRNYTATARSSTLEHFLKLASTIRLLTMHNYINYAQLTQSSSTYSHTSIHAPRSNYSSSAKTMQHHATTASPLPRGDFVRFGSQHNVTLFQPPNHNNRTAYKHKHTTAALANKYCSARLPHINSTSLLFPSIIIIILSEDQDIMVSVLTFTTI